MIPSAVVDAYFERALDNHLWVKDLNNEQVDAALNSLVPRPTLNPRLRLHQKACFLLGVAFPQFCFWLDMGCVAGDTLVEVAEGPVRIDELVRRGEPIHVWSNTSTGLRLVPAPVPFCKGETDLYEVEFVGGSKITVAANHIFLTEHGWTSCADLAVGERLPKFDVFRPQSNSEFYLSRSLLDVPRSLRTPLGFPDYFHSHSCGVQPPLGEDIGPTSSPSPTETLGRSRFSLQMDALGSVCTSTIRLVLFPRSKKDYFLLKEACCETLAVDSSQSPNVLSAGVTYPRQPLTFLKSALLLALRLLTFLNIRGLVVGRAPMALGESSASTAACAGGCACELLAHSDQEYFPSHEEFFVAQRALSAFQGSSKYSTPCETVAHINLKGKQHYYDMHVPGFHNYIAHGICHHNTGKTLLTLELLRYWWQQGKVRRAIIFVTSDKAFLTWEKQFVEFGIDMPVLALSGSSAQKWEQLEGFREGVVLLPYPGAVAMLSQRVPTKKGRHKLKLDVKKLERLSEWGQAFVLDESTRVGHQGSLAFKAVAYLRERASVRYALAGRPFGRDPTMLWAQHYLIDGGETLGETLGLFRAAFFSEKDNFWASNSYAKDYVFKSKLQPLLAKMIQHRSITYSADECVDLPKAVPIKELVRFPEEAQEYYKRVLEQVVAAKGNFREMKNAFVRMRQMSSGFVGFKNEDSGERAEVEFEQNPKLERLIELIAEVPDGLGSVVFYEFTYSGRLIVDRLKALGYAPIWLWSGTKDTKAELHRFAKEARPVAVINNAVGALSLDGLQHTANYDFEYEAPLSVISWEQARRRLVRDGQKHTVFQYSLQVAGTVDEKIRAYHAEGEELFNVLLRDPAKALGNFK